MRKLLVSIFMFAVVVFASVSNFAQSCSGCGGTCPDGYKMECNTCNCIPDDSPSTDGGFLVKEFLGQNVNSCNK
jgi:hypothetical protein